MTTLAEASFRLDAELAMHGCTRRDVEQIDLSLAPNGVCMIYAYLRNGDAVCAGFHLHGQPFDEDRVRRALSAVGLVH
jgi:hypothetical protein